MSHPPIARIEAVETADRQAMLTPGVAAPVRSDFQNLLLDGLKSVDAQVASADSEVRTFLLDPAQSPHHVMFALEQARLSVELMVQVRNRLVEGYQELMRLQL